MLSRSRRRSTACSRCRCRSARRSIRTIAVYLIVVVLLRIMGRRTVAQLNAFDLVVLLLLSNVVQNAIIGPDNSLVGGAIGVVTLLLLNAGRGVGGAQATRWIDKVMEGETVTLVHEGKVDHDALQHLGIREGDLKAALLNQGAEGVHDVHEADDVSLGLDRGRAHRAGQGREQDGPGPGGAARSTNSPPRWRA